MMKSEKVKVDSAYVDRYLEKNEITQGKFSEMNGHTRGWWNGIKSRCNSMVSLNQDKLICTVTGLDYEKLVIPERQTFPQNEHKSILEEDESLLKALVECMNRVETKMNEAALNMTRLEIQMRTVLKELGVK